MNESSESSESSESNEYNETISSEKSYYSNSSDDVSSSIELTESTDESITQNLKKLINMVNKLYEFNHMVFNSELKDETPWLILLKRLPETNTDESRDVLDKNFAQYKGDIFTVIDIINIKNHTHCDQINIKTNHSNVMYIVGENVRSNTYNDNISIACNNGIRFFKTVEAAYYHVLKDMYHYMEFNNRSFNYTGKYFEFYDKGHKHIERTYINGKIEANMIIYYVDGQKEYEQYYMNGFKNGSYTRWFPNGKKATIGKYLNGKPSENFTYFDQHGKIINEIFFSSKQNIHQINDQGTQYKGSVYEGSFRTELIDSNLNNLIRMCKKCFVFDNLVFKSIKWNEILWLIVLKKISNTKTNELRKVQNKNFAIYRGDVFTVMAIFNTMNPTETLDSIDNTSEYIEYKQSYTMRTHKNIIYDKNEVYTVGETVRSHFYTKDLLKIYNAYGIHFFTTIEAAYYYGIGDLYDFLIDPAEIINTGKYLKYDINGAKIKEAAFVNGKLNGRCVDYNEYGVKLGECIYIDGKTK